MRSQEGDPKIPDLILEKCHLKEPNEVLLESDRRILEEYPPLLMIPKIKDRAFRKSHSFRLPTGLFDSWMTWRRELAFGVFLLLLVPTGVLMFQNREKGTRLKGGSSFITIYKKAGDSFERLGSDAVVKENDLLQVSYMALGAKFGAIFSVDGNGKLTLHYPELPGEAAPLSSEGEAILPNAFKLDDSPGFERFIFVTSEHSFDTKEVIRAFKPSKVSGATFTLSLPTSLTQYSVLLRK